MSTNTKSFVQAQIEELSRTINLNQLFQDMDIEKLIVDSNFNKVNKEILLSLALNNFKRGKLAELAKCYQKTKPTISNIKKKFLENVIRKKLEKDGWVTAEILVKQEDLKIILNQFSNLTMLEKSLNV